MAVNEYKLPDVGEGLTEAELVSWKVKVGDTIKINDIVCEIETAKSLVELPSPYAGTIADLLVAEGETIAVGTPIISISSGDPAPATPAPTPEAGAEPKEEPTPTLVGYGPRETTGKRRARKSATTPPSGAGKTAQQKLNEIFNPADEKTEPEEPEEPATPADAAPASGVTGTSGTTAPRALAKPPVRKLAKDLGVDLAAVTPTGPGATVTRADVESWTGSVGPADPVDTASLTGAVPASTPVRSGERETRLPIKGVRKMTAQAMVGSAFTAPHVTEWVTIDVTRTMRYVDKLRVHRDFGDVKVSPLLVVAKAACLAMRRTPEVNASWDEAAQEIVLKHYVNLGIAAATPRGLVVPNVKDADRMGLLDLARSLNELTRTAKDGRTQPSDMSGGSFTITNVGVFGVDAGTPILNPGEAGILCFGAVRQQPWVVTVKGRARIKPRSVTTLALSFDHRLVDGAQGSRFLADVAAILEDPASAMLY